MSAPSLDELLLATKTPAQRPAAAPPIREMNDLIGHEDRAVDQFRRAGARRDAIDQAMREFPDATPDQLVEIAFEFEKVLLDQSQPEAVKAKAAADQEAISRANNIGTSESVLTGFPIAGGVLGTAIGGPAGGVVGAGLGGLVQSAGRKFAYEAGVGEKNPTVLDALRNARNQATAEAVGFEAADKVIGGIARFFRGTKEVADPIIAAFGRLGMQPALQDFSNTALVERARSFFGVLPMANRPFRRRSQQVSRELGESLDNFIADVSPEVAQTRRLFESGDDSAARQLKEDLSGRVFRQFSSGFEVLRRRRDLAFRELQTRVGQIEARYADAGTPLVVPPDNTMAAMGGAAERITRDIPVSRNLEAMDQVEDMRVVSDFVRDVMPRFVTERMTFSELVALKRQVRDRIALVKDNPTAADILKNVQNGLEQDIEAAANLRPEIADLYNRANGISEEFLTMLQDISSKRAQRIQKSFGRQGLQAVRTETGELITKDSGPVDISQMVDMLVAAGSPNEVRQFFGAMSRAVGEREAQRSIRVALGTKIDAALETTVKRSRERGVADEYVPGVFLDQLGLGSVSSKGYNSTIALFEASGISPQRARDVATVIDALNSVKSSNVGQLLMRQAGLGGLRTILRSLSMNMIGGGATLAAGAAGGPIAGTAAAVFQFMVLRSAGKLVTVPWRARAMVAVADARLPEHRRLQAAFSLMRDTALFRSDDEAEDMELREVRREYEALLSTKEGGRKFLQSFDEQMERAGLKLNGGGVR